MALFFSFYNTLPPNFSVLLILKLRFYYPHRRNKVAFSNFSTLESVVKVIRFQWAKTPDTCGWGLRRVIIIQLSETIVQPIIQLRCRARYEKRAILLLVPATQCISVANYLKDPSSIRAKRMMYIRCD